MLQIIKEKYPNLLIKKQNRYFHDKYGYSVCLIESISEIIHENLHSYYPEPDLKRPGQMSGHINDAGGQIRYAAIKKIFDYIVEPLKNKKMGSRCEHRMSLHLATVDEVISLVDLIQQVQKQYNTPDLIYQITAVPDFLSVGEQWVTNPALRKFRFRVMLRPFNIQQKHNFLEMIRNYGSDIKMRHQLSMKNSYRSYIYTAEFYCVDDKILTFVNLAAPGLIRKIYQLNHQQ